MMFMEIVKDQLKIKRPISLTVVEANSTPEGYDGSQYFENGYHQIQVANNPSRGFYTCLAHELIHAAIDEQAPKAAWHGFLFRRRAARLEEYLKGLGYPVNEIYNPRCDK